MAKEVGIYEIKNTYTGKMYIGSSKDIQRRWAQHRNMLKKGRHHSVYLQNAWNSYGEDNFEFSILEIVEDEKDLLAREQVWMDYTLCYDCNNGYNMSKNADYANVESRLDKVFDVNGNEITVEDMENVINNITISLAQYDKDVWENYRKFKGKLGIHRSVFMRDLYNYYLKNDERLDDLSDCFLYSSTYTIYYHLKELCQYDFFHCKLLVEEEDVDLIEFIDGDNKQYIYLSKIIQYEFTTTDYQDFLYVYTRGRFFKIPL